MRASWIGWPIFVLLVGSIAQAGVFDPTAEQWRNAHVDSHFLKKYIQSIYPCYESPRGFLGCVELIDSIGSASRPPVQLVPKENADAKSILQSFGNYALVPLTTGAPATPFQKQQQRVALLQAISTNWKGHQRPIDFLKLADQLLRTSTQPRAEAIGVALNHLIAVHDFYGELGPVAQQSSEHEMLAPDLNTDGIGVGLDDDGETVFIQFVYRDSPAEKGGLQVGDEIAAIDGKPITDMDSSAVVEFLLGRPGTFVTVEIRRPNGRHKIVKLMRAHFETPDVVERMVDDMGTPILDIMVSSFLDDQTCRYIQEDLTNYPEAEAIILDLRGNVGGLADQARCVASLFVGKKLIYSLRSVDQDGTVATTESKKFGQRNASTLLPLAILIDSQTSSAAEIVAGALQDDQRAWIVGHRSFGKGSVQKVVWVNPNLMSKSTVAEYFLPSGRGLEATGVKPDFIANRGLAAQDPAASKSIREADFAPFSLPPVNPNESNPRQGAIDNMNNYCLSDNRAESHYLDNLEHDQPTDLQLYKTEEVLTCASKTAAH